MEIREQEEYHKGNALLDDEESTNEEYFEEEKFDELRHIVEKKPTKITQLLVYNKEKKTYTDEDSKKEYIVLDNEQIQIDDLNTIATRVLNKCYGKANRKRLIIK